jgi:UDP-N-acetylmuramate--alanine ligase
VALDLDIPFRVIKEALGVFQGADRRFQIKDLVEGIYLVDDYGHHPTEIKATLATAKGVLATEGNGWDRRLIVIFQPHRYTRTRDLISDFYTSFYQSDVLFITDIYSAGEKPIEGITASNMAEGVKRHGHRDVRYMRDKEEIPAQVMEIVRPGDMILTLGAGDIWKIDEKLLTLLKERFS